MSPINLAQFAAQEYRRRGIFARRQVESGHWSRERADSRMRPWLAIACWVGADLHEFERPLADLVITNPDGTPFMSEAEARALISMDICPRRDWVNELARARDAALDKLAGDHTELDLAKARGLAALADHLRFAADGKYPVPLYHAGGREMPKALAA